MAHSGKQSGVATTSGVEHSPLGRGSVLDVESVVFGIVANLWRIFVVARAKSDKAVDDPKVADDRIVVQERPFLHDRICSAALHGGVTKELENGRWPAR
jgi:hypothetical protein